MTERLDVAYVGRISSAFIPMVQVNGDPAYYLPVYQSNRLVLSAGALSDGLDSNNTPIVRFQGTPVTDGWTFQAFNSDNSSIGYLTLNNSELVIGPESSTFTVTTTDPNGYASGSLLTGVRYVLGSGSSNVTIPLNNSQPIESGDKAGLLEDTSGESSATLSATTWTLVPITMSKWTVSSPSSSGSLPATVRITQCVNMQDQGYGQSDYCTDWKNYRGFTTSEDVQPIIYYYSAEGSCGESYTFNNTYLGNNVTVSSSRGDCAEGSCQYINDKFTCEEDSLLNWRVLILLAILAIILIIVILAIVGFLAYRSKQPSSPTPASIPTVA